MFKYIFSYIRVPRELSRSTRADKDQSNSTELTCRQFTHVNRQLKSELIKRLNVPQQKRNKPHRHWDKDYQTYEELKVSACHQCIEQGGNVEDAKLWMGFLHLQWGTFR
ncbi:hypothetical protein DPMN_129669 [Dreissena polymorpha]|uniref:Uncharacterized protein n=1 Tax=Dreissena polymorpha TaxID=45954 RepID=A0A9D4H5B7_DREPO|nr:hypothetical protein DPMN_129669 [Dreissena polymorpha]